MREVIEIPSVDDEYARLITALEKRHEMRCDEDNTLKAHGIGWWLFEASQLAPHRAHGSTHCNYLCGLFDRGVMLFINQHRHIEVLCAESPEIKIAHWGNQDSRYTGSMYPTLDKGRWIGYYEMPRVALPSIHDVLYDLLQEARAIYDGEQLRQRAEKEAEETRRRNYRESISQAWTAKP
jgi:hypothetical protein